MNRICVVGPPGSGKSTLARRLGDIHGLPVLHIDTLSWKPGWIEADKEELANGILEFAGRDRWVIDGNYSSTLLERFRRAEMIVFLDLKNMICMRRIVVRRFRYVGRSRPDMTEGCPERIGREFWKWARQWHGGSRGRKFELIGEAQAEERTVILRSPREVRAFVKRARTSPR